MMTVDKGRISGDPFKASPYFDAAEKDMTRHWNYFIWPRIREFDRTVVIDLACGHGRNTEKFIPISGKVIAADINQECINACQERFKEINNVEYLLLDDPSLSQLADGIITLVYSWDSMVHFEPEVVEKYVAEFARTLKPGGYGFIHHSNHTSDAMRDFKNEPHWRNYMSKDIFRYFLRKNNLITVSQEIIGWDDSVITEKSFWRRKDKDHVAALDCISIFKKPDTNQL